MSCGLCDGLQAAAGLQAGLCDGLAQGEGCRLQLSSREQGYPAARCLGKAVELQ